MPEIPTFVSTQSLQAGAQGGMIPLSAGAAVGNALAEGLDRVSAQFAHAAQQAQELQRAADASRISTDSATQIAELALKFSQDPDQATAPQRFRAETQAIRAKMLETTSDPRVQNIVTRSFDQHALSSYVDLSQNAIKKVNANAIAGLSQDITRQSLALSTANNQLGEDAIIEGIGRSIAAQRAGGILTDAQSAALFSQSMKQAIYLRSNQTGQAGAAQAMFDRVKDRMTSDDIIAVSDHLRTRVESEAISGKVDAAVGGGATSYTSGGGGAVQARAHQAYTYFTGQGFSPEQSAAITANIQHESNFNPTATHDSGIGYGILGWNGQRRAALEAKYGKSPTFEQQLEFVRDEIRSGSDAGMAAWGKQQGGTAGSLGADLSSVGVRPKDVETNRRLRGATADRIFAQFGGRDPREANVEPSLPIEPQPGGPPARGVLPNVTGVPSLASMIQKAEALTANDDPATRQKVLAGVIQRYNQAQAIATADITHQLELKSKIDAAVKHDMERAQEQVFSSFVGKIAAGEDVPAQSLALALSTQSISRAHYDFLDKIATQRREGTDDPRTVLELNTALIGSDQQPRILQATQEGRLSNKTAVELVRRNQEMRQKPFQNAEEEQGYRQVTSLLGGDKPLVQFNQNEARRLVRAQQEYVDRIRAGEAPRDVVNDIGVRYPQETMNIKALPAPRFGAIPNKVEDTVAQMQSLRTRRDAGNISAADYDREAQLLGEFARILQQQPVASTTPQRGQRR